MAYRTMGFTGIAAAMLVACGASGPSEQLIKARSAYDQTSNGAAARYAPARVLDAKQALTAAENADDNSPEEKHLAYIAMRKAELADAEADLKVQKQSVGEADTEYQRLLKQQRETAKADLDRTRDALRDTVDALGTIREDLKKKDAKVDELQERRTALEARKAELEKAQAALEQDLSASEKARKDAEDRAAAALASLDKLANVKEEARETVITLSGSVLFETGKSALLPIARERLSKVADALKEMGTERKIVIEGHTDSRGAEQMNYKLSLDRAAAVREYLVSQGIDPQQVQAEGKGESRPIADNGTPEGRANNRRVEIHIEK